MKNLNKWWPGLNYINSQFQILISLPTTFDFQKKKNKPERNSLLLFVFLQTWGLSPHKHIHTTYTHTHKPHKFISVKTQTSIV